LEYTNRITRDLELTPQATLRHNGNDYFLPLGPGGRKHLLLVPMELLDALPLALDPSNIDQVSAFNDELRVKLNLLFADARTFKRRVTKSDIREIFFGTPQGIATLVRVYRETIGEPYDFTNDPLALFEWEELGFEFAKRHPLQLLTKSPKSIGELKTIVTAITTQFKKNIE